MRKLLHCMIIVILLLSLAACSNDQIPIEENNDASTQNSSAGTETENIVNDNTTVTGTQNDEMLLEDFQIDFFLGAQCSSSGEFWVKATNSKREEVALGDIYIWTDSSLIPLQILSKEEYSICSDIYNGITLVRENQTKRNMIINVEGCDITSNYANIEQGEQLIGIWEDSTGISVWTVQDVDTYDKHITTLYAKDISGNIKMSWSSDQFPDLQLYESALDEFEYIGNGTYMFDQSVVDINSGKGFCYPPSGNSFMIHGTDEKGNVYTFHNNGSSRSLFKYSNLGDEIWKLTLYKDTSVGQFANGFIYVKGEDGKRNGYNGFLDQTGSYVIATDLNISNVPVFIGDYAIIEIANEAGVKFVTLMDTQGNMLFEPVKGTVVYSSGKTFAERTASLEYFLAKINDEFVILNTDGTYTAVPAYWNNINSKCLQYNGSSYYVIENSKIVLYEYAGS